ncbi:hypothetical protein [Tsukamurella paurometabola]|uniref:Uncharacterized protein n=1 Tax=Tsukamurella paurometabola TaxID=2061 RepID=A0ABS5NEP0_TSUPA|nr:hypothetical protein [Tsukamurella paurometabola]MBS4102776.1 hypothetical protein [Tsukamurella paurometabola]
MPDEEIQKALAGEIPVEDLSEADREHVRAVQQLARERHDELLAEYRATQYTFRVEWAEDVRRWRATCDQLHGLSHPATTPEGAIRGLITTVGEVVKNNQEWFWSPEWQAGEREVDDQIARGEVETFASGEEFVTHLEQAAAEADQHPRLAGTTPAARREAAKLVVALDRQEGKPTDPYITAVAAGERMSTTPKDSDGMDNPWMFLPDDLVPTFLTELRDQVQLGNHEGVYEAIERWRAAQLLRAQAPRQTRSTPEEYAQLAADAEAGLFVSVPGTAMISVQYLQENPDALVRMLREVAPDRLAQGVIDAARGDADGPRDLGHEGTDTDIHRTVPTDATVDWVKSDTFASGTSTIYLIALPVHLDPGYDVVPDLDLGYFLDPHEAAAEARRRLQFQVENAPVEHRHNFAASGAAVIPVSPNGYPSGLPLKPWSVRLARKGTDSDQ